MFLIHDIEMFYVKNFGILMQDAISLSLSNYSIVNIIIFM